MLDQGALRALPKAELHRHLDGSVRLGTLAELARRHGLDLGAASEAELAEKAQVRSPLAGLEQVIERFGTLQKVLCCYEAIRRVAFENVEDAWRDGVRLLELRFAPAFIAAGKKLAWEEIIEAVLDGVEEGVARCGIAVGLIGILPRTAPMQDNCAALAELLRYARGAHPGAHRLVGLDLADSETARPPGDFLPLVQRARAAGLGITIHSGENTDAAHVVDTIRRFSPTRLGHGIKAWGDREALRLIAERGVTLEVCPTSNWLTRSVPSLEAHPLPRLLRAGVRVTLNSDDPHLMGIDLVHEYALAARLWGMGPPDFLAMNQEAVRASFLPEEARREALRRHFAWRHFAP
jgi:adenosine deaminase